MSQDFELGNSKAMLQHAHTHTALVLVLRKPHPLAWVWKTALDHFPCSLPSSQALRPALPFQVARHIAAECLE